MNPKMLQTLFLPLTTQVDTVGETVVYWYLIVAGVLFAAALICCLVWEPKKSVCLFGTVIAVIVLFTNLMGGASILNTASNNQRQAEAVLTSQTEQEDGDIAAAKRQLKLAEEQSAQGWGVVAGSALCILAVVALYFGKYFPARLGAVLLSGGGTGVILFSVWKYLADSLDTSDTAKRLFWDNHFSVIFLFASVLLLFVVEQVKKRKEKRVVFTKTEIDASARGGSILGTDESEIDC